MGERLAQQVVVENRPGAGGTLGAEVGARAAPDGYTLLLGSGRGLRHDGEREEAARLRPGEGSHPDSDGGAGAQRLHRASAVPVASVPELVAFAKANPGKIRYGSPGVGSNPHLIGELFANRFGIVLTHVPYKGGGAGIADVRLRSDRDADHRHRHRRRAHQRPTGEGDRDDRRRALAADFGRADDGRGWRERLRARRALRRLRAGGTPREPIERLAREVPAVDAVGRFRRRVVDIGQEVTEPLAGEAFGRAMRAEAARWRSLHHGRVKDE